MKMYSFDGKPVLITGGCGSLGTALVVRLLSTKARRIVVFDNNQTKLNELERRYTDPRLRFLLEMSGT
jgi:FlaA1/EpsC-like NDP-sugar epimerase